MASVQADNQIDVDALLCRVDLAELARGYGVVLHRRGPEWVGCCPFHGEKTPSFTIFQRKGRWIYKCFGCGASGNAISMVSAMENTSWGAAIKKLAENNGMLDPATAAMAKEWAAKKRADAERRERDMRDANVRTARLLYERAFPISGDGVVATYLRARGIDVARTGIPSVLRWSPREMHVESKGIFPVMMAPLQDLSGTIMGLHRTYLAPDGSGKAKVEKAKKMLGQAYGCAIRLCPAGEVLAIAEGIETGMSVMAAMPELPVWVAGSLGNMAGSGLGRGTPHPDKPGAWIPSEEPDMARPGIRLPPCVREVILLGDADGDRATGKALLERAARRFQNEGLTVRVALPPEGMDFNDLIRQEAA